MAEGEQYLVEEEVMEGQPGLTMEQHVVIEQAVQHTSTGEIPEGAMIVEDVQLGESEDGSVVYIVQQDGTETDGMSYTLLNDGSGGHISLQRLENANLTPSIEISDPSILKAISEGHIQVIESSGDAPEETRIVNASDVIQGSSVSQIIDQAKTQPQAPTYITIHGRTSDMGNIEYVFACQYCEFSSKTRDELTQHIAKDHIVNADETKGTDGEENMEAMEEEAEADLTNFEYKCPFCSKMFTEDWQTDLEKHIREIHPDKTSQAHVVRIKRTIGQEKQTFDCKLCNKSFHWPQILDCHVKVSHPDATPEELVQFSEVYKVADQKQTGKEEQHFACMLCDKVFKWPKSLKAHLLDFHSTSTDKDKNIGKKKQGNKSNCYKCLYCDLVTKYVCSIRKHIERKHQDKLDATDVSKLHIPKVHQEDVKTEILTLDTRPPQIRLSNCNKIFRCPFCDYATQLPSNMTRHLTSRNHNFIFTPQELSVIKVKSFMVVRSGKEMANTLPPLKFPASIKSVIDEKKIKLGIPVSDDDLETEVPEIVHEQKDTENQKGNEENSAISETAKTVKTYRARRKENIQLSNQIIRLEDESLQTAADDVALTEPSGETVVIKGETEEVALDGTAHLDGTSQDSEQQLLESVSTCTAEKTKETTDDSVEKMEETLDSTAKQQEAKDLEDSNDKLPQTALCIICKKIFIRLALLLQHVSVHEEAKVTFTCHVCQEEFDFFSRLKQHVEKEHVERLKELTGIGTVKMSVVSYKARKAATTYECPYCEMLFSQLTPLQQHVTMDHSKLLNTSELSIAGTKVVSQYNCFFCELSFVSLTFLVKHMELIHPNAERPALSDDLLETPTRRSSRKRKAPKWLEEELDVSEEVSAKRKKVEIPVRYSVLSEVDKVPDRQAEIPKKASKLKADLKETEGLKKQDTTKMCVRLPKIKTPKRKNVTAVQSPGNKSNDKDTQDDFKTPQTIEKRKLGKSKAANTPKVKKVKAPVVFESPVITEHKCPHCSFTAKRSSALSFHINFNHKQIKEEPVDPDYDAPLKTVRDIELTDDTSVESDLPYNPIEIKALVFQAEEIGEIALDGTFLDAAAENDEMQEQDEVDKRKHKCKYCQKVFKSSATVANHVKTDHKSILKEKENTLTMVFGGQKVYKCTVCSVLSNSVDRILLHMEVAHPLEAEVRADEIKEIELASRNVSVKYLCPYCPFKTKWRESIPRHIEKHHPSCSDFRQDEVTCEPELEENTFLCPYCLGVMNSKSEVIEHANEQHSSQPALTEEDVENVVEEESDNLMKCPFCETYTKYKRNLIRHVKRVHPERNNEFDSTQIKDLEKPTKVYKCEYCGLESKYRTSFLRHLARRHPQMQGDPDQMCQEIGRGTLLFKCQYCGSLYTNEAAVDDHIRTNHSVEVEMHTADLTDSEDTAVNVGSKVFYKCPVCSQGNRNQNEVLKHMRETHGDTEEFDSSDVVCVMKMNKAATNIYVCKHCKQGFGNLGSVVQHTKQLHGKNIAVDYSVLQLKNHEELVNNFKCPSCSLTSIWRRSVLRHIKAIHPELGSIPIGDIKCSIVPTEKAQVVENGNFMCPYCDVTCKWKKSIIRHIRLAHTGMPDDIELKIVTSDTRKGTKLIKCKRCENQTFKNIPILRKHYAESHPDYLQNLFDPNNFEYIYTSVPVGLTQTDIEIEAGKEKCQCIICGAIYLWKKSLFVHVRRNHPELKEVYQMLDKMVDLVVDSVDGKDSVWFTEEESTVTKEKNAVLVSLPETDFVSQTASESLMEPHHLVAPRRTVSKMRIKKCGLCSAVFRRNWSMRTHYCLKHGQSGRKRIYRTGLSSFQYTCRVCALGFFTQSALLNHSIKRHRNKPPAHMCMECGYRCASRRSFKCHQYICFGKWQQHKCSSVGCSFKTKFIGRLRYHMRREHTKPDSRLNRINKNQKCEMCGKKLESLSELRQHIYTHLRKQPVNQCDHCRKTFATSSQKDRHIRKMHTHAVEICEICGDVVTKKTLAVHMRRHSKREPVQCTLCNQMFNRNTITYHYVTKHPFLVNVTCTCDICQNNPGADLKHASRCDICDINFCQKIGLMSHNQIAHGGVRSAGHYKSTHKCQVCRQVFFTVKALKLHVSNIHNMKEILMQECPPNFTDSIQSPEKVKTADGGESSTTHVIHIGQGETTQYLPKLGEAGLNAVIKELIQYDSISEMPYKCILCGRCFSKSKYIKLHIRRSHVKNENQPYRCKVCGSGFVRLTEFRKHTRSHSDFRPYKCKFCNKAFKQQANLKEHYLVHGDAKQFVCYICNKTFKQRGAMTSHVVGHDTLRPFKCVFCGRGYTTRGELSRHMKKYDQEGTGGEKNFSCHLCMESFLHFPLLLKHIDQHYPEKPFQCQVCLEKFSNYVTMYLHKVKYKHFLESEIIQNPDDGVTNIDTVRRIRKETRKSRVSKQEQQKAPPETVYLNTTDDMNLLQNTGESTIEVIIEDLDQNSAVQVQEKQPERDELLSIAQQLTELSSRAEKGVILKEEDEIIKNMLDADEDVLANLHKQSTVEHKWDRGGVQFERSSVQVQDFLREPETVIPVQSSVSNEARYNSFMTETDASENEHVTEESHIEIQMDAPAVSDATVPNNFEELAQLISQNSESGEVNNVLAYHNEDGSIIYVCLPEKDGESETVVESQVIDNGIPQHATDEQGLTTHEIYTDVDEEMLPAADKEIAEAAGHISFVMESNTAVVADSEQVHNEQVAENEQTVLQSYDMENIVEESEIDQSETVEIENEGNYVDTYVAEADEQTSEQVSEDAQVIEAEAAGSNLGQDTEEQVEMDIESEEKVVEYQNDEKTFIKEELLDGEYPEAFDPNQDMAAMYTVVKEGKYFRCLVCDSRLSNIKNLKTHLKRHLPEKGRQHACEYCSKRFITNNELKRHVKIHLNERDHVCKYCGKGFIQSGQLTEHLRTHTGEKPYKCQDCEAVFVTSSQCKQHWRRIHGQKDYPCNQCNKSFKSMPDLTRHRGQMHSDIRKKDKPKDNEEEEGGELVCHICGKGFVKEESLMAHLYHHAMENVEFKCVDCDKTFRSKESLNSHRKAKHEGFEFICPHCNEMFTWKKSLMKHLQTKHGLTEGEEPTKKTKTEFTCKICEKVFASQMSLAYHMGSKHVSS